MGLGFADIVVILLVAAAFAGALTYIVRRRRRGKCIGCSGDCSRCGYSRKK